MKGPATQPQGFLGNAAPKRFSSFGTPPAGGFGTPTPAVAGTGAALTSPTQGWMNKPNVGTWTPGAGQPPWAGNSWGRSTGDPLATALTTGRTGSWKANGEWTPGDNAATAATPAAAATGATPAMPSTTGTGATPATAATPATPAAPSFGDPALQAQYTNEQLWGQGLGKRPTYTAPPAPTSQLNGFSPPYSPTTQPGYTAPVGTGGDFQVQPPTTPTPPTNIQNQYSNWMAANPQAAPFIDQLLANPQYKQMFDQYIAANPGGLTPDGYAQLKAGATSLGYGSYFP